MLLRIPVETNRPQDNPFLTAPQRPHVAVVKGDDPYANTCAALAQIDLAAAAGKRVLLKPNVGRVAAPASGVITNPQVVAAAIDAFQAAGARVSVGESPIVGVKTEEAFDALGLTTIAAERDCPLLNLDARRYVRVEIPHGRAIQELKVCPDVLEHDLVVSIPVMKTHMHTGVTLSVKNMKGCLWRRSKVDLHMLPPVEGESDRPLNIAIADMSGVLRPHLSIIDGTVGMEGLGPSAGRAKPFGVVVAGADPFAADAVACRLMGINATDIPHLRIAGTRGYGVLDLDDLDVSPTNWQDWVSPFAPPPASPDIAFPGTEIFDRQSCSACQSTLLLFLKRYGEQLLDYFPEDHPIRIAIGQGHDSLPPGTLCIGNCTSAHKDDCIFVRGCPPVASAILRKVQGAAEGGE